MKLLWNEKEFSQLQKEFINDEELFNLIKVTLIGKLEYQNLFKIYDYILGNLDIKSFFNQKHTRNEIYNFLLNLEV